MIKLKNRAWLALLVAWALLPLGCSGGGSPSDPDPVNPVPTTLTFVEGSGLQAPAGTILPQGPTVELRDQEGKFMEGVTVTFQVLEGQGEAVIGSVATDAMGRARSVWILGPTAGATQRFKATAGSVSAELTAQAIVPAPGQKYSSREGYADYYPGTLPLVLTAPHGGSLRPTEIPDRTWGTTGTDTNTLDLALKIREAVFQRTGAYPHVVVSNLHRIKLDPNREIEEAAQGDREAERAWWEYHTFADRAGDLVEAEFGEGFYIDLHGHGHEIARLELGYLLASSTYSAADSDLDHPVVVAQSSVKVMASRPGASHAAILRGPLSLGTLLEGRGYPSVPSTNQPTPGNDPYFNGGYSTVRHASRDSGSVSGVQIECNYAGVRDTSVNRQAFAEALADALLAYFPAHMGMPLAPKAAPGGE